MKITTLEVAGFKPALHGMRNPKNSWDKGDSGFECELAECNSYDDYDDCRGRDCRFIIGENDMKLATTLAKSGSEHSKYLRQIQVWADFDMPRYWWSEFDTYHFNSKNSCSTMHKLMDTQIHPNSFVYDPVDYAFLLTVIGKLRDIQKEYRTAKENKCQGDMDRCLLRAKRLLPEGFLQMRTVNTNYAEIANVYHQRKHHRQHEEWVETFCAWAESLPYFRELCIDTRG